jgi:hypothetical protein
MDKETKWTNWSINQRFMRGLHRKFGEREFTLRQAYKYYSMHHSQSRHQNPDDNWLQMNARNSLAAATHQEQLVRVRPGVYTFKLWPTSRVYEVFEEFKRCRVLEDRREYMPEDLAHANPELTSDEVQGLYEMVQGRFACTR